MNYLSSKIKPLEKVILTLVGECLLVYTVLAENRAAIVMWPTLPPSEPKSKSG